MTDSDIERIADRVLQKMDAKKDARFGARAVSKTQASKMLKVSRSTVHRMCQDGRLHFTANGITLKSIQEFKSYA